MEIVNLPLSLRDLSHELRTPLTGILRSAELMKDEELTPNQQNFINNIIKEANKLAELANRLLEAKQIPPNQIKKHNFKLGKQQELACVGQFVSIKI